MLINVKGQHFHVDMALGPILIAAGIATEIHPPAPPKPVARSSWRLNEIMSTGEACIEFHCATCRYGETFWGKNPEALKHSHCGIVETCPPHIVAQYKAARRAKPEMADAQSIRDRQRRDLEAAHRSDGIFPYSPSDPAGL